MKHASALFPAFILPNLLDSTKFEIMYRVFVSVPVCLYNYLINFVFNIVKGAHYQLQFIKLMRAYFINNHFFFVCCSCCCRCFLLDLLTILFFIHFFLFPRLLFRPSPLIFLMFIRSLFIFVSMKLRLRRTV